MHSAAWFDVEHAAVVEVTSEDDECPIEAALIVRDVRGWRARTSGDQTIRLIFDQPQDFSRIALVFKESEVERTQEFALRWSGDGGSSFTDIVRQQWNFSPPRSIEEVEDYRVQLSGANVLELTIRPNISGGEARATLKSLRLS